MAKLGKTSKASRRSWWVPLQAQTTLCKAHYESEKGLGIIPCSVRQPLPTGARTVTAGRDGDGGGGGG